MRITIVGHRGARGLVTENTLESIQAAADFGVSVVEYDLRLTSDKKLVLSHDASLRRVFGIDKLISEFSSKELDDITSKSGEKLVSLEQVLENTPNSLHHLIELKDPNSAKEFLKIASRKTNTLKRLAVTTFEWTNLSDLQQTREFIKIFAASRWHPLKALKQPADGIMIRFWQLNPLVYYLAKKSGKMIAVYTINSKIIMKFFSIIYPKILVCTDRPDKFEKCYKV